VGELGKRESALGEKGRGRIVSVRSGRGVVVGGVRSGV